MNECFTGIELNKPMTLFTFHPRTKEAFFLKVTEENDQADSFIFTKTDDGLYAISVDSSKDVLSLPKDGPVIVGAATDRSNFSVIPQGNGGFFLSVANQFAQ